MVNRDEQVLFVITITLVTLAVLTVISTAWASVIDATHASALMLALGATQRRVRAGLAQAQVHSVIPGAILGVPPGIGLLKAVARGSSALPSPL
jgi:putative ABC transport system permease protein